MKKLLFEITNSCRRKCLYCSSNSTISGSFTPISELLFNVERERGHDLIEVILGGGEPLLHPGLPGMMHVLRDMGLKTVIYTGGAKPGSYPSWGNLKPTRVVFNMPCTDPKWYRKLTGSDINELYSCMFRAMECTDVDINLVLTMPSATNIRSIMSVLGLIGVRQINIIPILNKGRVLQNQWLIPNARQEKEALNFLESVSIHRGKINIIRRRNERNKDQLDRQQNKYQMRTMRRIGSSPRTVGEATGDRGLSHILSRLRQ